MIAGRGTDFAGSQSIRNGHVERSPKGFCTVESVVVVVVEVEMDPDQHGSSD